MLRDRLVVSYGTSPNQVDTMIMEAGLRDPHRLLGFARAGEHGYDQTDFSRRLSKYLDELREQKRIERQREIDRSVRDAFREGPAALATVPDLLPLMDPRLRDFAESYRGDRGCLLLGPTKAGKTSCLVHAVKRLIVSRSNAAARDRAASDDDDDDDDDLLELPPSIMWVRALDLGTSVQRYGLGQGAPILLLRAQRARLLVIDDLGWEGPRGMDPVVEVIASRYDTGRQTALTSGLTWDALVARYSEAAIRRPLEAGGARGKLIDLHPTGGDA